MEKENKNRKDGSLGLRLERYFKESKDIDIGKVLKDTREFLAGREVVHYSNVHYSNIAVFRGCPKPDVDTSNDKMIYTHSVEASKEASENSPLNEYFTGISIKEMFDVMQEYLENSNKQHDYSGIYCIDRLVKYTGMPIEVVDAIIKGDREIDYKWYNLFRADEIEWSLSPYETTMYVKYKFLDLSYIYSKPKDDYKISLPAPTDTLDDKAYVDSDGNLHFIAEMPNLQHLMQEPLNGKIAILEDCKDDYGVLYISLTKDLFDMIPSDWLHNVSEEKTNYACANEQEVDFLVKTFCLDKDMLEGNDYFRFIIKEREK